MCNNLQTRIYKKQQIYDVLEQLISFHNLDQFSFKKAQILTARVEMTENSMLNVFFLFWYGNVIHWKIKH